MLQTLNQKVIGFRMHVIEEILSHFQFLQIGERIGTKTTVNICHCNLIPSLSISGFYLEVLFWGGSNWSPYSLYETVA